MKLPDIITLLEMAFIAKEGLMSPRQREPAVGMPHERKCRRTISNFGMAGCAIVAVALDKFSVVFVSVTVRASLKGKQELLRECEMPGRTVALFTSQRLMLAGQTVTGQPVIERFLKSEIPSLCRMAGRTCFFLHRKEMWGGMTRSAIGVAVRNQRNLFSGCLLVDSRMAPGTCNLGVFSLESKRCPGMVEPTARLPVHCSVTGGAVLTEFVLMGIRVTRVAGRRQTEERLMRELTDFLRHRSALDTCGGVAFLAVQVQVLAYQRESGSCVVEPVWFKRIRLCRAAEMFLVARGAALVHRVKMKSLFGVQLGPDFFVACETFLTADFLTDFMTLRAVLGSFERLMCARQVARRELTERGMQGSYIEQRAHEQEEENMSATVPQLLPLKNPGVTKCQRYGNMCRKGDEHDNAERKMNDVPVVEYSFHLCECDGFLQE